MTVSRILSACLIATVGLVGLLPSSAPAAGPENAARQEAPAFTDNQDLPLPAEKVVMKHTVLQGNLREAIYSETGAREEDTQPRLEQADGYVTQAGTTYAMAGATVSIPALNYATQTGRDGGFTLPPLPKQPVIASITKPGYVPRTITLDQEPNTTLRISLRQLRQTVILDNEIRHLGDGSYSPVSAGAGDFRRKAEGVRLVRQFRLPQPAKEAVFLQIGSIVGLDTAAAHRNGQSVFHRTSSPMVIKISGTVLAQVQTNGDGLRIPIPARLLNLAGINTLEIATGYQVPDGAYIDYDDIELMLLTLDY